MRHYSLLIDDDVALCQDIAAAARDVGHDVDVAHTWEAGLEKFKVGRHQLLICDYNLQGRKRGLTLLAEAKRFRPSTRLVLISGFLTSRHEAIIEPAGVVDAFLPKGSGLTESLLTEIGAAKDRSNRSTDWKGTARALRERNAVQPDVVDAVDRVLRAAAKISDSNS